MHCSRLFLQLLLLVSLVLLGKSAQAQTVTAGPDSAQVATQAVPDSSRRTERLLGMRVTRPQKAALLALVLPGAGQVYNHKYWKLPLVYGAIGGTGYGLYFYQIRYKAYSKAKDGILDGQTVEQVNNDLVDEDNVQGIQTGLNNYRGARDKFIAYTALAYGITILDALVDAHLRDFDISEDLSLRLDPAVLPTLTPVPATGLALTLYLK